VEGRIKTCTVEGKKAGMEGMEGRKDNILGAVEHGQLRHTTELLPLVGGGSCAAHGGEGGQQRRGGRADAVKLFAAAVSSKPV
jgi:hypothetical protein